MDFTEFRDEISRGIRSFLTGRRIAPDVSVLLSGILDAESPSGRILRLADKGTIVLSAHTEEMARKVLRSNAPSLLGAFGAGIVELSTISPIERVPSVDQSTLGSLGQHLSGEDRQVLADAISGKASVLYTHDSEFFRERIPGMIVMAPGSQAYDPFGPDGVRPHPTEWTYLGWFVPQWGSDLVRQTTERFYIFEIARHVACYYDARSASFVLEWRTQTLGTSPLRLPQNVEVRCPNFVTVTASPNSMTLFANGETRRATVSFGPAPNGTTLHPFNSSQATGQISGGCQFRLMDKSLTEATVRRHWRARTLQLTDGEIQWMDAVQKLSLLITPPS